VGLRRFGEANNKIKDPTE